jgi:hypothetical protein
MPNFSPFAPPLWKTSKFLPTFKIILVF